ncbi:hypothetical protein BBJ28_00014466 [Nothophytophthora sp. Chile5]|nr:hypothetical protein BBJ28_00014466 [Nothophytophthora sp. Chile5]
MHKTAAASSKPKRARGRSAARKEQREAPAPNKNAYLHFSRSRRDDVAAAHPAWSVQQVSAELGRQWKALTASERKPWVELAQFDKARFQTEAKHYVGQQHADEQPVRLHIPFKRKKQPNEPRQPDTAYICFWKSRRREVVAANPQLAAPLVSKEVGRQWRALADDERQVWLDLAAQDKLRFQEELARFHPTLQASPEIPAVVKAPIKDPFAPKPAKTGFQLFMSHNRESFTLLDMTLNEFRAEMSQLWKRLNDDDKSAWYQMAQQDQMRYEAEVNAYMPPAYMSSALLRAHKRLDELKRLARGDAGAPRLPVNAYSCYLSTKRREMQLCRPELTHNAVMREMGVVWKALSEAERAPYQRKAELDVERFQEEMETYLAQQEQQKQHTAAGVKTKRTRKRKVQEVEMETPKTRKKRKLTSPRRPKTAYNLMYMSKRAELLATYQMSHNECSALCGRLWRQMSDVERDPYQRMAAEDKRRYQAELQSYQTQVHKAREAAVRDSAGFRYFVEARRRESEGQSEDEITAMWLGMSEPHQVLWAELANDGSHATLSTADADVAAGEEQKQLEESARTILAAREMHFPSVEDNDDSDDHDENEQQDEQQQPLSALGRRRRAEPEQKRSASDLAGFLWTSNGDGASGSLAPRRTLSATDAMDSEAFCDFITDTAGQAAEAAVDALM